MCVTCFANIQKFSKLHNVYLSFSVMASFLSIVKIAIFTGLYLGPSCEHSVETNVVAANQLGEQHIPVVKSLCERVFNNLNFDCHSLVYCVVIKPHLSSWS